MKIINCLAIAAIALSGSLGLHSCAEPDDEFTHTDSSIHSIEIQPEGGGAGIQGYIDEVTGEIYFPIPKTMREKYDVTSLVVRANVEYDTYITPSLTGLKDLSDPIEITVKGGDGGTRTYTMWAYYIRRTE